MARPQHTLSIYLNNTPCRQPLSSYTTHPFEYLTNTPYRCTLLAHPLNTHDNHSQPPSQRHNHNNHHCRTIIFIPQEARRPVTTTPRATTTTTANHHSDNRCHMSIPTLTNRTTIIRPSTQPKIPATTVQGHTTPWGWG